MSVGCPSVGCPWGVRGRDRWHRAWPAIDGTVRGPRSMAPCVARDRWHRAWPAIDGTVRGPRSMAPCVARRSNVAVRGLCSVPCVARSLFLIAPARSLQRFLPKLDRTSLWAVFAAYRVRPSFRIVLADVCGPECRQKSLCAVFAKIAFSPTRNTKWHTTIRALSNDMLYFILLTNTCSRLRETLL